MLNYEKYRHMPLAEQQQHVESLKHQPGYWILKFRLMDAVGIDFSLSGVDLAIEVFKAACIREGLEQVFREVDEH